MLSYKENKQWHCWAIITCNTSCKNVPNSGFLLWGKKYRHRNCEPVVMILPTYSTVQSPSWEANWFAASQEIPRISQNKKVHYRTHKHPPPVTNLDQPNPVHIPTSHLLEIHPKIIHPSTPRSPQWSPSLQFPHQDPIHPPLLTHSRSNDITYKILEYADEMFGGNKQEWKEWRNGRRPTKGWVKV